MQRGNLLTMHKSRHARLKESQQLLRETARDALSFSPLLFWAGEKKKQKRKAKIIEAHTVKLLKESTEDDLGTQIWGATQQTKADFPPTRVLFGIFKS